MICRFSRLMYYLFKVLRQSEHSSMLFGVGDCHKPVDTCVAECRSTHMPSSGKIRDIISMLIICRRIHGNSILPYKDVTCLARARLHFSRCKQTTRALNVYGLSCVTDQDCRISIVLFSASFCVIIIDCTF